MYCTKGGMVSSNEQKGGRVYLHKIKKEKKKAGISQVGVGAVKRTRFLVKIDFQDNPEGTNDMPRFSGMTFHDF